MREVKKLVMEKTELCKCYTWKKLVSHCHLFFFSIMEVFHCFRHQMFSTILFFFSANTRYFWHPKNQLRYIFFFFFGRVVVLWTEHRPLCKDKGFTTELLPRTFFFFNLKIYLGFNSYKYIKIKIVKLEKLGIEVKLELPTIYKRILT